MSAISSKCGGSSPGTFIAGLMGSNLWAPGAPAILVDPSNSGFGAHFWPDFLTYWSYTIQPCRAVSVHMLIGLALVTAPSSEMGSFCLVVASFSGYFWPNASSSVKSEMTRADSLPIFLAGRTPFTALLGGSSTCFCAVEKKLGIEDSHPMLLTNMRHLPSFSRAAT